MAAQLRSVDVADQPHPEDDHRLTYLADGRPTFSGPDNSRHAEPPTLWLP